MDIADLVDEALCTDAEMAFEDARKFVAENVDKISDKDKLRLYGLYKQATEGPCSTSKPFFDFKGRAKWDAWKAVGDLSAEEAMTQYADILTEVVPDWEKEAKAKARSMGPVVSSLAGGQEQEHELQTLHDWVTEGDVEKIAAMLEAADVNARDEEGCTALHFAADRGHADVVALLVGHGAEIDAQDVDGATALHYASLCENEEVCKQLLDLGADASVVNSSGEIARQLGPSTWDFWQQ